jgi:ATP-dependent helicase/nuclease subunit A
MTIHSAKGLESPIVIIADDIGAQTQNDTLLSTSDGTIIMSSKNCHNPYIVQLKDKIANARTLENQRLMYVAMTRAEEYLAICKKS